MLFCWGFWWWLGLSKDWSGLWCCFYGLFVGLVIGLGECCCSDGVGVGGYCGIFIFFVSLGIDG